MMRNGDDGSVTSDIKGFLQERLSEQFKEILLEILKAEIYFRLDSRIASRRYFSRFQAVLLDFDKAVNGINDAAAYVTCIKIFSKRMASLDALTYSAFERSISAILNDEGLSEIEQSENENHDEVVERASIVSGPTRASFVSASSVEVMQNALQDPMLDLIYKRLHSILKAKQDEIVNLEARKRNAESRLNAIFKADILDYENMSDVDREKYEMLYLQANYPVLFEVNSLGQKDEQALTYTSNRTWQAKVESAVIELYAYPRSRDKTGLLPHVRDKIGGWRIFSKTPSDYYTVVKLLEALKKEALSAIEVRDALRRAERICRSNPLNRPNILNILGDMRMAFKSAWDDSFNFDTMYPNPEEMTDFENHTKHYENSIEKYDAFIQYARSVDENEMVVDGTRLPKTIPDIHALVYFIFKKNIPEISFMTWTPQEGLNITSEGYQNLMQIIADLRDQPGLYYVVLMFCVLMIHLKSTKDVSHYNFFESQLVKALSNNYILMQEENIQTLLPEANLTWVKNYMPHAISTSSVMSPEQCSIRDSLLDLFSPQDINVEIKTYSSSESSDNSSRDSRDRSSIRQSFIDQFLSAPSRPVVDETFAWRKSKEAFAKQAERYLDRIIGTGVNKSTNFNPHAEEILKQLINESYERYSSIVEGKTLMLLFLMKWFCRALTEFKNKSFLEKAVLFISSIEDKLNSAANVPENISYFDWKSWEELTIISCSSRLFSMFETNKTWGSATRLLSIAKEFYPDGNVLLYQDTSFDVTHADFLSPIDNQYDSRSTEKKLPPPFPLNFDTLNPAQPLEIKKASASRSLIYTAPATTSNETPVTFYSKKCRPPSWYGSIEDEVCEKMREKFCICTFEALALIKTQVAEVLREFSDPGNNQNLRSAIVLYCVLNAYGQRNTGFFERMTDLKKQLRPYIQGKITSVDLSELQYERGDLANLFEVVKSLFLNGMVCHGNHIAGPSYGAGSL